MKIMPMMMMLLLIVVVEMIIILAPTPPNVRPNVYVCYRCIYPGVFPTVRFPRKELSPKLQTNRKPRKQNATRIERMVKYVSEIGTPDPETPMSTRALQPYKIRSPPVPALTCLILSKCNVSVTRPFVPHTLAQEYDAFPQADVRHSAATSTSP